jgi:acyl-coenzyme A synthetase/AMP-(fatty) acid ligase
MMTRHRTTQLITVLVLAAALSIALVRKGARRVAPPPPEPRDAVYAMLAAARAGDVKAYLDCYTGPTEEALRQTVKESTPSVFAKYLRDSQAAVKGVAVSDPQKTGDREATLRVEYVYQDRNESQTLSLEKVATRWKIARVDNAARVPVLIPYGTPVK